MPGIVGKIEGVPEVKAVINALKSGGVKAALDAMGLYFVGNESHGLKHYPPQRPSKYVRTGTLRGGWRHTVPQGNKLYIRNENVPYASYVQGNPPARHMIRRGWRSWVDVINSNMDGAIRAAQRAVASWMASKKR